VPPDSDATTRSRGKAGKPAGDPASVVTVPVLGSILYPATTFSDGSRREPPTMYAYTGAGGELPQPVTSASPSGRTIERSKVIPFTVVILAASIFSPASP